MEASGIVRPENGVLGATIWIGWRKSNVSRSRWEAVCKGTTESEAFRKLLGIMARTVGHWSTIVLPEGRKP